MRALSLTPELVARCHRAVADAGPAPGGALLDDADYRALGEAILAGRRPEEPVWLFAYGSLIWKPEIEHVEERIAVARGWHRAFCMRMTRFRGTADRPGLMMALDRGGQCRGMAYRLPDADLPAQIDRLLRREMTAKPPNHAPRWLELATPGGPLRGIGFVIARDGANYAGRLEPEEAARLLAGACGHWGSGAEYLANTVSHLEARGIHDRALWRLQELVAREIEGWNDRYKSA